MVDLLTAANEISIYMSIDLSTAPYDTQPGTQKIEQPADRIYIGLSCANAMPEN